MDNTTIIALTGKARSGKDTAALAIRDYLETYHQRVTDFNEAYVLGLESFAAPLKSMIAMLLDFFNLGSIMDAPSLYPYLDGDQKEEVIEAIGASPRKMLQTLGTDWGRKLINEDLWLNCMRERVEGYEALKEHGYKGSIVVITDCRFDNEAKLIQELGGTVVQIVRDNVPEQVGEEGHPSEAGVSPDLIGLTVHNNGTVEEFQAAFIKALGDLLPELPDAPEEPEELDDSEAFFQALFELQEDTEEETNDDEEATDAVEERSEART